MLVPQGALILVADESRVALLRNNGGDSVPHLESVPPEAIAIAGNGPLVARDIIAAVDPMLAGGTPLVLVAPSNILGKLRAEVPPTARRNIVAAIVGDKVARSTGDIARQLTLAA